VGIHPLSLKPLTYKIKRKLRSLNKKPNECVLIGDQLFTDILAGNISGFYTIKIEPLSKKEGSWTKFVRKLEKLSIKMMRKKPKLFKEKGGNNNEM
jgi:HAD superfamily phosphatase (TIGR01668 family)